MADPFESIKQHIHETTVAGTEELYETAMSKVEAAIVTPPGVDFLSTYFRAKKHKADHGQLPTDLDPSTAEAVKAIEALTEARVDNIMRDPGLSITFGNRNAAYNSYLVSGLAFLVVNDVAEKRQPQE
ncbi:hypothetical protein KY385_00245 [Candidatus Parcubacteria bacterium]|nr:hypothetical protein [Candidatus Parcubacteria bacterium]